MPMFYEPTSEMLAKLNQPWCASFSGGKDSTSLVTWIEWLRRTGQIRVARPQLVQSDTEVEDPRLQAISAQMMELLRGFGWECVVVHPKISEKLYNRILGIGNIPIHPGVRRMRWCTRSTKVDPMKRWHAEHSAGLMLTGMRIGESAIRDGKIKPQSCSAGGECGIPAPNDKTYSPIINWTTCNVFAWLDADFDLAADVRKVMSDVFQITKELVVIYNVKVGEHGFGRDEPEQWAPAVVTMARFGCIGCPAIQADRHAPKNEIERHGADSPLHELYDVWYEARLPHNRLSWLKPGTSGLGPIKMDVRKILFARVMDIQRRAGVTLITAEDEAFIRQCWENNVYPRGWSAADELTSPAIELERDAPLLNLTINGKPNMNERTT